MDEEKKTLIDLSYLQEVASDNSDFMIEMIDIFLAQTPEYVSILSDAIDQQNWDKIAEMAHKIKPTLAFMGANEAKETIASIESRGRAKEDYEGIMSDFGNLREDFNQIFTGLEQKRKELLANG
ncbi:MAG TPA: Hpt domain-containing protein [Pelobium sp.]|jgi:HPt (histidine-containing phosphotransfer) domain-containing protein|nr:Hpt domain-containing protein [Pelobium sp.]